MKLQFSLWPGGKNKCLTLSYDDGRIQDRRLVEIMNRYGVKGTFHLNTAFEGRPEYLPTVEYRELYRGHEISVHTHSHPSLIQIPPALLFSEIMENRRILERAADGIIRGMSYPYGEYSDEIIPVLRSCGMEYSRTVEETGMFGVPSDFMRWNPTCHHNRLGHLWQRFVDHPVDFRLQLFYLWGHSYEFTRDDNWQVIEEFCRDAGGRPDIWYTTNIKIKDYVTAVKNLKISADMTRVSNSSGITVWFLAENDPVCIGPGETLSL